MPDALQRKVNAAFRKAFAMPLYEFECTNNHLLEALVPVDTPSILCPECGLDAPRVDSVPARRNPAYGIQR